MTSGALPQTPRFIAFVSGRQYEGSVRTHCLPQTRYGAQVAPRRCPILRVGKALSLYHVNL